MKDVSGVSDKLVVTTWKACTCADTGLTPMLRVGDSVDLPDHNLTDKIASIVIDQHGQTVIGFKRMYAVVNGATRIRKVCPACSGALLELPARV